MEPPVADADHSGHDAPQPAVDTAPGDHEHGSAGIDGAPGTVERTEDAADLGDPELIALRTQLERITQLPLEQRVALFERTNEVLAAALGELDEV